MEPPPSPSNMSNKRKLLSSLGSSSAKRPCPSNADDDADMAPSSTSHPRNHPVYGQKSAFPGLDTTAEDELSYGPAEDGMEYLRMVRSEANALPFLFTAPKSAVAEPVVQEVGDKDDDEDQPGRYADGVYVAPTATDVDRTVTRKPSEHDDQDLYPEAQMSYYNLLRHRFLLLRSTLKCTPPFESISALDDSHPISLPRHSFTARKEWRWLLLAVDPQMVQLACMDMDSVLGAMGIMARLMSENFRSGDVERVRRIGAWAWGLLGKCREVGQLGTQEVGDIRDLGKRAVKILQKMKEEEDEEQELAGQDEGSSVEDESQQDEQAPLEEGNATETRDTNEVDVPAEDAPAQDAEADSVHKLEAAKARLQARLQGEDPEPIAEAVEPAAEQDTADIATEEADIESKAADLAGQIRAMLDMIITVVGEFYGQRDLLEKREVWGV